MATTSLIVEFVLIGFQTVVWLVLFAIGLLGTEWLNLLLVKDWIPLITIGLIGTSYTFGLVVDWLSVRLLPRLAPINVIEFRAGDAGPDIDVNIFTETDEAEKIVPKNQWMLYIRLRSPEIATDLERRYNQVRLIAGTLVNLVLITAFGIFAVRRSALTWTVVVFVLLTAGPFILLCIATWRSGWQDYTHQVRLAVSMIGKLKGDISSGKPLVLPDDGKGKS